MVDLDPYEMHRRIRYYESKIEILYALNKLNEYSENENMQIHRKLNQLNNYLAKLGINEDDLKKAMVTGTLKLNGISTSGFDSGAMKQSQTSLFSNKKSSRLGHKKKSKIRKMSTHRDSLSDKNENLMFSEQPSMNGSEFDELSPHDYSRRPPSKSILKRSISLGTGNVVLYEFS